MNANGNRQYRPQLELLEDRFLLSGYRRIVLLPAPQIHPIVPATRGTGTPADIHTIVNPANVVTSSVSIVPQHISLGLFDQPTPITISGVDPGLTTPGLPVVTNFASDPGLTMPGLPIYCAVTACDAPSLAGRRTHAFARGHHQRQLPVRALKSKMGGTL